MEQTSVNVIAADYLIPKGDNKKAILGENLSNVFPSLRVFGRIK